VTTLKIESLTYIATRKPPPKLMKALAVITTIHDEYAKLPWLRHPDVSKESCVMCALTVRDFLQRIGFKDARVRSVTMIIKAKRGEEELHSLGIGTPMDRKVAPGKWAGHLVTTVDDFLIDTTLAPSKRPQWPDLTDIVAMQMFEEPKGHRPPLPDHALWPIAAAHLDAEDGSLIEMVYLDRPDNQSWKTGGDAKKDRRRPVVDALVKRFGPWRGS